MKEGSISEDGRLKVRIRNSRTSRKAGNDDNVESGSADSWHCQDVWIMVLLTLGVLAFPGGESIDTEYMVRNVWERDRVDI
jgi:hypothetical protein